MKKIFILLLLISGISFAEEYGYFYRESVDDPWINSIVQLEENDRLIFGLPKSNSYPFINTGGGNPINSTLSFNQSAITFRTYIWDSNSGLYDEDMRTVVGPGILNIDNSSNDNITYIPYRIIRSYENIKPNFQSILNANGDHLALGYFTSPTNFITKIYSFDGINWNQKGNSIESHHNFILAERYGFFYKSGNWTPVTLELNDSERLTVLRNDIDSLQDKNILIEITRVINETNLISSIQTIPVDHGKPGSWEHDSRVVIGPCSMTLDYSGYDNGKYVPYKITNSDYQNLTYTISINADGSRVSIGYHKNNTMILNRVYEYTPAGWTQLGQDILE